MLLKRYTTTATFVSRYSRRARRARGVFRPLPRALCFLKESEPNGLPVRSTRRLLGAARRASPDTPLYLCVCVCNVPRTPFAPLVIKTSFIKDELQFSCFLLPFLCSYKNLSTTRLRLSGCCDRSIWFLSRRLAPAKLRAARLAQDFAVCPERA